MYNTLSHGFRGRCTAPLVVNPSTRRPVSNESADIVRYLDSVFVGGGGAPGASGVQLYPAQLAAQIDALESQVGGVGGWWVRRGFKGAGGSSVHMCAWSQRRQTWMRCTGQVTR